MCIYSTFTGKSNDEIAAEFEGKGYGDLKLAVAEVTADALAPVQTEYARILADKATWTRSQERCGACLPPCQPHCQQGLP